MSKRALLGVTIGSIAFGIAGIAFAASATKYFQRIKQTTYSGSIKVTAVKGVDTVSSATNAGEAWASTWKPGDSTPKNSSQNACYALSDGSTFNPATCESGHVTFTYQTSFTTTTSALPTVSTDTDPPTFYSKTQYYLNGKAVSLPGSGTAKYTTKSVTRIIYYNGTYKKPIQAKWPHYKN